MANELIDLRLEGHVEWGFGDYMLGRFAFRDK